MVVFMACKTNSKKGQAALDFLMTYGWAIALVVIIAAVLFALGIFDVSNFVGNKASGFAGVAVANWQLTSSGIMSLRLSNQVGQRVSIDSVVVTIGLSNASVATGLPAILSTGQDTEVITTGGLGNFTSGTGYSAKVVIRYTDQVTGFVGTSTGTLMGKAV